jgi:hypothetical protein
MVATIYVTKLIIKYLLTITSKNVTADLMLVLLSVTNIRAEIYLNSFIKQLHGNFIKKIRTKYEN